MDHWRSNIELSRPFWEDYRDGLLGLDGESFPDARKLNTLLPMLDEMLAECLLAGSILDSPASLSPLPLMGIPGWWPPHEQNDDFYADRQVFRPPHAKSRKAPVYKQQNLIQRT